MIMAHTMGTQPQYPECEKMKAVHEQSQAIGQFLEWLEGQGMSVCQRHEHSHDNGCYEAGKLECGLDEDTYYPIYDSIEKILARHFDIDLDKVEAEKQAMLASIRSANETH